MPMQNKLKDTERFTMVMCPLLPAHCTESLLVKVFLIMHMILPSMGAGDTIMFNIPGSQAGGILEGIYSCPVDSCENPVVIVDDQVYADIQWNALADEAPPVSSFLFGSQTGSGDMLDTLLLDIINYTDRSTQEYFHVKYVFDPDNPSSNENATYNELYTFPFSVLPTSNASLPPTISMLWAAFVAPTIGGNADNSIWTLGINLIDTSNTSCVRPMSNSEYVNFPNCTTNVATLYNNCSLSDGAESGFPAGCRDPSTNTSVYPAPTGLVNVAISDDLDLYFATVFSSLYRGPLDTVMSAELWVAKTGDMPDEVQRFSADEWIMDEPFCANSNAGGIEFRYDEDGIPIHMCRSVSSAGITCQEISVQVDGTVEIVQAPHVVLNSSQVLEYCNGTFACEKVVSGIRPVWKEDDPSGSSLPETVYFGCNPDDQFSGGFFKVSVATGQVSTVVDFYNPGSIIFGLSMPSTVQPTTTLPPSTLAPNTGSPTGTPTPNTESPTVPQMTSEPTPSGSDRDLLRNVWALLGCALVMACSLC